MNFTAEQLEKAKTTKSAEELLTMAKENGIAMTEEQAKAYFAELNTEGELSDDELDAVAGGGKALTYNGYEVRSGGWKPCDEYSEAYANCSQCPHFHTLSEDTFSSISFDGYCDYAHK